MLMRRAGLAGLSGSRGRRQRIRPLGHSRGPGRPQLRPSRTRPPLGDRRDRTPNPGTKGVLRGHPRHLQPPSRGLVHRPLRHLRAAHLPRVWPSVTASPTRGRSYTQTKAPSSPPGRSVTGPASPASFPPSVSVEDCFDNAVMESFRARMQAELVDRRRWRTRIELANAILEYHKTSHNRQRRPGPR